MTALIDGGGNPGKSEDEGSDPGHRVILPYLRRLGIQRLDWVVATHPDEDHCQGLVPVVRHFRVAAVLAGDGFSSGAGKRFERTMVQRGVRRYRPVAGMRIDLGEGVRMEVINPWPDAIAGSRSPRNDEGIVLMLIADQSRALLAADAERAGEHRILTRVPDLRAELLKVGHHGSNTSTQPEFLNAVAPRIAVVSVGKSNRYGHPSDRVLRRLNNHHCEVWRTDVSGAIFAETTGKVWKVHGFRKQNGPAKAGP
jgi:competence protein ComEC